MDFIETSEVLLDYPHGGFKAFILLLAVNNQD